MKKLRTAVVVAIALMGTGAAATAAAASDSIVIPRQQESYGQLGVLWWKWVLSIPAEQNPLFDTTGADCAVDQSGGRWFLVGSPGGSVTRSCTLPADKKIFFPIISVENDYPCPEPPIFQPAPGQSLKDFLTNGTGSIPGAVTLINQATDLQASLDGASIPILASYRGTSNMYSFAGDPSLTAVFDPCITGSQQKAVSDGYWLLLAPLSSGQHTLQFGGSLFGNPESATYKLTVHSSTRSGIWRRWRRVGWTSRCGIALKDVDDRERDCPLGSEGAKLERKAVRTQCVRAIHDLQVNVGRPGVAAVSEHADHLAYLTW
jgi:hypothetical protein